MEVAPLSRPTTTLEREVKFRLPLRYAPLLRPAGCLRSKSSEIMSISLATEYADPGEVDQAVRLRQEESALSPRWSRWSKNTWGCWNIQS